MGISTAFNYDDLLSLNKAKLVSRERKNFLDTKELILDYHGISSSAKEDCVEWLQTSTGGGGGGRLTLLNPEFSFKTYEGTWTCVSIAYNEDANVIRQIYKIDSTVGDLGDVDVTAVYANQAGDSTRISDGMEIERSYYWRISNPERILLPTATTGEIWTKTANDNGDGTYDVIVTKETEQNLTADSAVQAATYTEASTVSTNTTEQAFVADGGSVADAVVGEIKRIDNVPLENGKFRTTVTTRTAISSETTVTYASDWGLGNDKTIVGINQSFLAMETSAGSSVLVGTKINSVSFRINDYGLYDYTMTSKF